MKTMPGFEFCAFRFLIQWQEDEQKLHAAISSSTPAATDIRGALSYFQVARNFKDLNQPEKTAFVLNSLLEVRADQTLQTPDAKVARLTQRLQEEFDQNNLSAASKLLWLSYREPYIVYDGRAVTALIRDLGYRFPTRDYPQYSKSWREEYEKHKNSIGKAIEHLPKARMFMRPLPLTDEQLLAMARESWFQERVLDIFLWEIGEK
jgi:hypothetical protein